MLVLFTQVDLLVISEGVLQPLLLVALRVDLLEVILLHSLKGRRDRVSELQLSLDSPLRRSLAIDRSLALNCLLLLLAKKDVHEHVSSDILW